MGRLLLGAAIFKERTMHPKIGVGLGLVWMRCTERVVGIVT